MKMHHKMNCYIKYLKLSVSFTEIKFLHNIFTLSIVIENFVIFFLW